MIPKVEPDRAHHKRPGRRLRDVDAAEVVDRWRIALWALAVGLLLGGIVGYGIAERYGLPVVRTILLSAIAVGGAVALLSRLVVSGSGAAAGMFYAPRGGSTPYRPELSHIEALVARGDYQAAATLYRETIGGAAAAPDSEPMVKLARLYRDHLAKPEAAAEYFRRARALDESTAGLKLHLTEELIALHRSTGQLGKAITELARLADMVRGSAREELIRQELIELKRQTASDDREA